MQSSRQKITRTRELLACSECRARKLKCDRKRPCGSCTKRNDETSCIYQRLARDEREREKRIQSEARLEHLEGLVQQLAAAQNDGIVAASSASSNEPRAGSSDPPVSTAEGHLGLAYSGSTHWSAMLEDIDELRAIASEDSGIEQVSPETCDDDGTSILYGAAKPISFDQILTQYLPSRLEADRLVASYFRSKSVVAPMVHGAHFQRRYQQFWRSPESAPPLWTSLFFSVCHIANITLTNHPEGDRNGCNYLRAAAQCLAIGEYYKPQQFAVEALLLFAQAKCFRGLDITSELGMIMSSVIRLATSSGYHRDPYIFRLSEFEKEMRRRTWSLCVQLDMLVSFALGLPSNVQYPTWSSRPPRNLLDTDFDEDMTMLPQSRPDSEPTGMMFYIAKFRLMVVFEKILRYALSMGSPFVKDPAVLNELETELNHTYSSLAEVFQPRCMADSVVDPPSMIITRLCILFLYQKSRCVLHRKPATIGFQPSIAVCYEASSSILHYFLDVYHDLQPGGQLETEKWFDSTLTWQDFLLATTTLCLVLCITSQNPHGSKVDYVKSTHLLLQASNICSQTSYKNKSTDRIEKLVDATIRRLGLGSDQQWDFPTTNGHTIIDAVSMPISINSQYPVNEVGDLWTSTSNEAIPIEDASWAYLEQFLELPGDDATLSV